MPSMVREVSAILVLTTTFLPGLPPGTRETGASLNISCCLAGGNEEYKKSINGFRMNYPDGPNGYREKNVIELYKFEKDITTRQSIKYTMVEGFPISMNAMEISYGPTDLLRLTVNFSFVRYVTEPYSTIATTNDALALNFNDQGNLSLGSQLNA